MDETEWTDFQRAHHGMTPERYAEWGRNIRAEMEEIAAANVQPRRANDWPFDPSVNIAPGAVGYGWMRARGD